MRMEKKSRWKSSVRARRISELEEYFLKWGYWMDLSHLAPNWSGLEDQVEEARLMNLRNRSIFGNFRLPVMTMGSAISHANCVRFFGLSVFFLVSI